MRRYYARLSFRMRRLFARRKTHVDVDGNPVKYHGIHSHDESGEFLHILVKRPIRVKPASPSERHTRDGS